MSIPLSHLDSHQHVHTIPQLFPVIKAIQRRFGLRRIRATRNIYTRKENPGKGLLVKKLAMNWGLRRIYTSRTTDGFTDLPGLLDMGQDDVAGFRSIELMVHPGAADHEWESATLCGDWARLLPFPVELCSYHQF